MLRAAMNRASAHVTMDKRDLQLDAVPEEWRSVVHWLHMEAQRESGAQFDFADIFAGSAHLNRAMHRAGMLSFAYDVTINANLHNILSDVGLTSLLSSLLRVKPGGVVWLGPPCSTWVWISRATYRRSRLNPSGDVSMRRVQEANRIVDIVVAKLWVFIG